MRLIFTRQQQWMVTIFCFCVILAWSMIVEVSCNYPSYIVSTLVIIVAGLGLVAVNSVFSFRLVVFMIIFTPALSPAYAWILQGKGLFSLAAQNLQHDQLLIDQTVFLYAVASVAYFATAGSRLPNREITTRNKGSKLGYGDFDYPVLLLIGLLAILNAFVLESGPTILTANYTSILAGRLSPTPVTALLGVTLGGLWAMVFVFGRHHKYFFWGVTLFLLSWLFLHVRRVESFGIVMVLVFWGRHRLKPKILFVIFFVFVWVQGIMGVVRNTSLSQYLAGGRGLSSVALQEKAALPGGASNIFLSGLHLVNVKNKQLLDKGDQFTMAEWPRSIVPNTVWRVFGCRASQTEHQIVYEKLDLQYVGGMPLLAVYYLNGGIFLVVVFGLLHGVIGRVVDNTLDRWFRLNLYRGGSFIAFIVTVFIVYQFRYQWYMPQTMFRAIFFSMLFLYLPLSVFVRRRIQKSPPFWRFLSGDGEST